MGKVYPRVAGGVRSRSKSARFRPEPTRKRYASATGSVALHHGRFDTEGPLIDLVIASDLHVHDFAVGLNQPVAHLQSRLKSDVRLLSGDHRFLETDRGVVQRELLAQPARLLLQVAGGLKRTCQGILKPSPLYRSRLGQCLGLASDLLDRVHRRQSHLHNAPPTVR